jgi:histidyl-tRNA synthetase
MSSNNLSNNEVKGTKDWLPDEFFIRDYIFKKWREVCLSYGFLEYLTPLLEKADIYRAKSGEDVGGKELMIFVDQGGRELAIRPEMTPSVVRMTSKVYSSMHKPLKLFSVANFIRNEKPQRGRNREFWQLNCDIFGEDSESSDLEILQLCLDVVLSFNPPKGSFVLGINNRGLINELFSFLDIEDDQKIVTLRLMDKYNKMSADKLIGKMEEINLNNNQIDKILKFIKSDNLDDLAENIPTLKNSTNFSKLIRLIDKLESLGYKDYVEFRPDVIRGFDYYDDLVFELFDKHPDNNRAMFGGGRYNGLASIFGSNNFPAIGFAPGDETFKLFLDSWNLLPKAELKKDLIFIPILDSSLEKDVFKLSRDLRLKGKKVETGLAVVKISKALEYADKSKMGQVVILGKDELSKGVYKIKDMKTGEEDIEKL